MQLTREEIVKAHDEICNAVQSIFDDKTLERALLYVTLLIMQIDAQCREVSASDTTDILDDINSLMDKLQRFGVTFVTKE